MHQGAAEAPFPHRHLLGIEGLSPDDINHVLDLADGYVELNRQADKKRSLLRGRTIINCFFENSTPTRTSFEVAGKRLGGDVINMSVSASSMVKGKTLIDTAMTLNAVHPDVLVKGANHAAEDVVGAERIRDWGGKLLLVDVTDEVPPPGGLTPVKV